MTPRTTFWTSKMALNHIFNQNTLTPIEEKMKTLENQVNYLSNDDICDQLAADNREIKSKLDDIQINNIAMANRIAILEGQLKGKNPAKTHEKDKHERQEINKPIKVCVWGGGGGGLTYDF